LAHRGLTLASDNLVQHWDMHDAANDFALRDEYCACWLSVSSLDGSRIPPSNRGVSTMPDVGQSTTTTGNSYSGWAYRDLTFTPCPMDFLAGECFDRILRLGDVGGSLEAWPISECENVRSFYSPLYFPCSSLATILVRLGIGDIDWCSSFDVSLPLCKTPTGFWSHLAA
jgi:hypothetical protein